MRIPALLLILLLVSCGPRPVPASPALWQVEGADGRKAWLFGTIHALDAPTQWRSGKVGAALNQADVLVVELADVDDDAAVSAAFEKLAHTPGQPPLTRRISPALRQRLDRLLADRGLTDSDFADVESWAAAVMLARSASSGKLDPRFGIDRAILKAARSSDMRIVELEGADGQLQLFDTLPQSAQGALLDAVVSDTGGLSSDSGSIAAAWRKGDMAAIERESTRGILADPTLRAQLFTMRNANWQVRLADMMARGDRPFVAVGAAHMVGPDGLPAMLEARGYAVTRIQ